MFLRAEEYFRPFYAPLSVKRCVYRNINSAFSALKLRKQCGIIVFGIKLCTAIAPLLRRFMVLKHI